MFNASLFECIGELQWCCEAGCCGWTRWCVVAVIRVRIVDACIVAGLELQDGVVRCRLGSRLSLSLR